jgi:uncharacterized protein with PQ loop repeat
LHTLKLKKADDFSLSFLLILFSGLFLFSLYGLLINAVPLFLESIISCAMLLPMFYYKVKGILKKDKGKE